MKKGFSLLVLLCVSFIAMGDVHGQFEIGKDLEDDSAFSQIKLEYDFDVLKINIMLYGSWLTWFWWDGNKIFMQYPFRDIYEAGAVGRIGIFFIDLNHWCSHHVDSPVTKKHQNWHSSLTTLSIGIKW